MSTKVLVVILLGLAVIGGSIYAWVLSASVDKFEDARAHSERLTCRANFQQIANAQMAYRMRSGSQYAESLDSLEDDFTIQPCPGGGEYTIKVGEPANAFTVHCSVRAHDVGTGKEPSGYSPGLNSS